MIESLESRQFFSGETAVWVDSTGAISIHSDLHITKPGTLVIKGTDAADNLSVIRNGKMVNYRTNNGGNIASFFTEASKVKRVLVEAGGGDDRVFIDPNLGKACTVTGGSGNDRIDGNLGSTLIGGAGNDRLFASTPKVIHAGEFTGTIVVGVGGTIGNAVLSGGAGNDTLIGSEGNDFIGGVGRDTALLYLPDADPKTFVTPDGKLGGKSLTEYFTDATGLELYQGQVGTGKDSVFTSTATLTVISGIGTSGFVPG